LAPKDVSEPEIQRAIDNTFFYKKYIEKSPSIILATKETLDNIQNKVHISRAIDLFLDALSLASIFFLVQQYVPNYTVSIILALPIAFAVTFIAGILMERSIIRYLYHRPLETLLATFGVSIALQQLAKNIFGTQARPLTSPDWLDGSMIINDVISISWIRVAIFCLSLLFFAMLWFTLNKTRLGLETRAVTQNPKMAASMGINPDKINMLTFGLGSGIAGIAGVAIGLFAKVTSVGNIWGTLAGAGLIGFLQKSIEWFNPSNTLAAQTFMIVFIIIFIQFRPRGIIALKGRAAGD